MSTHHIRQSSDTSIASARQHLARVLHPAAGGGAAGHVEGGRIVLDGDVLDDIATGLAATADPTAAAEPWTITRTLLLSTPAYDAWLMVWGPAALSEPHDHDGSIGVLRVVSGELLETASNLTGATPTPLRRLRAGSSSRSSALDLHSLYNPSARPAVTVNVYSPPLGSSGGS